MDNHSSRVTHVRTSPGTSYQTTPEQFYKPNSRTCYPGLPGPVPSSPLLGALEMEMRPLHVTCNRVPTLYHPQEWAGMVLSQHSICGPTRRTCSCFCLHPHLTLWAQQHTTGFCWVTHVPLRTLSLGRHWSFYLGFSSTPLQFITLLFSGPQLYHHFRKPSLTTWLGQILCYLPLSLILCFEALVTVGIWLLFSCVYICVYGYLINIWFLQRTMKWRQIYVYFA